VLEGDLPRLRHFYRDESSLITEDELLSLMQRSRLQSLQIRSWDEISNATLRALTEYCLNVEEITISRARHISEAAVAELFQGCARTLLKVNYEGDITTPLLLTTLGTHCAQLEEIAVRIPDTSPMQRAPLEGWEAVAQGCPHLTSLSTHGCVMTDAAMCALAEGCPELCFVNIYSYTQKAGLMDRAMFAVGQFSTNLRSLQLTRCCGVTDTGLCAIAAGCVFLRSLRLHEMPCGDAPLVALVEHCPDLRVLHLFRSPIFRDGPQATVTDAGVTALVTGLSKLRELVVQSNYITEAVIPVIAEHCKILRLLELKVPLTGRLNLQGLFDKDVEVKFNVGRRILLR
jgi:hypothetical protein